MPTTVSPSPSGLRAICYVIVYVRDMARSIAFYRDRVGLPLRAESPRWTEFDLQGTTLALHVMEGEQRPLVRIAADPAAKKYAPTEIVFFASDPLAMRAALLARGVNIARPKLVHDSDDKVGVACVFEDLDGNRLSAYGIVAKEDWLASRRPAIAKTTSS